MKFLTIIITLLISKSSLSIELTEYLSKTISTHPESRIAKLDVHKANFIHQTSQSQYYPSISIVSNNGIEESNLQVNQSQFGEVKAVLNQKIYSHKNRMRVKTSQQEINLAKTNNVINKFDLIKQTSYLLFDYLYAKNLMSIRQTFYEISQNSMSATKKRYLAGELTKTDLHLSQGQFQQELVNLQEATNLLENSKKRLIAYTNISPENIKNFTFKEVSQLINQFSLKTNPTLAQLNQQELVAQYNYEEKNAQNYPEISLQASQSRIFSYNDKFKDFDNTTVLLQISIPIFTGWKNEGEEKTARVQQQVLAYKKIYAKQQIKSELEQSIQNLQFLEQAYTSQTQAKEQSTLALRGILKEYKAKNRSLSDILNTQRHTSQINNQTLLLELSLRKEIINYLYLSGNLSLENLKAITKEST